MRKSRHADIRAALLKAEDGLTRKELCEQTGIADYSIRAAVKAMPDVYIDRWLNKGSGAPRPVYMAVEVPENCPRPK
jgi:DNA-binding transcriptional regulator GbsR (MarR family)